MADYTWMLEKPIREFLRAHSAEKGGPMTVADEMVRDCCELTVADPEHPDTLCINVNELAGIAERYLEPMADTRQALADVRNGYHAACHHPAIPPKVCRADLCGRANAILHPEPSPTPEAPR